MSLKSHIFDKKESIRHYHNVLFNHLVPFSRLVKPKGFYIGEYRKIKAFMENLEKDEHSMSKKEINSAMTKINHLVGAYLKMLDENFVVYYEEEVEVTSPSIEKELKVAYRRFGKTSVIMESVTDKLIEGSKKAVKEKEDELNSEKKNVCGQSEKCI